MSRSEQRTSAIASLTSRANSVFRDRKFDAARPLYRDASVLVLLRSADCARELKDLNAALRTVNFAIEIDPNSPDAHSARAAIYSEMGDHKRAQSEYGKTIRLLTAAPPTAAGAADPNFLSRQYWLRGLSFAAVKDHTNVEANYKLSIASLSDKTSRSAIRCAQELTVHRTVTQINPKALTPVSSFPCTAHECKCTNCELFASAYCGYCEHAIDAHRNPSHAELFEHANAIAVLEEEQSTTTDVSNRMHKSIAASVKYATYHYLNFSDQLANGFTDRGRNVRPNVAPASSGSAAPKLPVREVLVVDIRDDVWLSDCLRRALNAVTAIPRGDERALELGRFVAFELGGSSAGDIARRCDEYLETMRPPPSPAVKAQSPNAEPALEVRVSVSMGQFIRLHLGACRHRAILYKYLADRCGVECRLVRGSVSWSNGGGGAHAWIIINKRKPKLIDLTASSVELLDPLSPAGHNYRRHGTAAHSPGAHSVAPFNTIATPYAEFTKMEMLSDRELSRVYKVVWRGRTVVIKELKPSGDAKMDEKMASEYDVRSFMREAGIMADFQHPNVVQLIAACDNRSVNGNAARNANAGAPSGPGSRSGTGNGAPAAGGKPNAGASRAQFAIILEYVNGGSLRDYISSKHAELSMSERIGLLVQCAEPLSEMHAVAIVHRDIKPDNICLTSDKPPQIKLCDFGLARYVSPDENIVSTTRLTAGTPHYMAPEQAMGADQLTPAIDAYAFGGVIYFVLYGKQPWLGRQSMHILTSLLKRERPPTPAGVIVPGSPSAAIASASSPSNRVDSKSDAAGVAAGAGGPVQLALYRALVGLMDRCYSYEPQLRPTMREIVDELRDLYDYALNPNPAASNTPTPQQQLPATAAAGAAAASTSGNTAVTITVPSPQSAAASIARYHSPPPVITPAARAPSPVAVVPAGRPIVSPPPVQDVYAAYAASAMPQSVTVVVVTPSAEANSLYPPALAVGDGNDYPPAVIDSHGAAGHPSNPFAAAQGML